MKKYHLKPSQNKKSRKHFSAAPIFEYFFSAASCKKSIQKTVQLEIFLAPSYFDPALAE